MFPKEIPSRVCTAYIRSRAVHDHHHDLVNNGWDKDSDEHEAYQEEIERLNEFKWEDYFIQGWRDCEKGLPQRRDNDAYLDGYGAKYERDQVQNELNITNER